MRTSQTIESESPSLESEVAARAAAEMHRDHRGAMYAAGAVLDLVLSTESD